MPDILYISFHTPELRYVQASARLEASLKQFSLPYEIRTLPSLDCWNLNCCIKPKFILSMVEAYPNVDRMIWIDADAQVMQYPEHFKTIKADMAAVINEQGLFASLIFLRNNKPVRDILRRWIAYSDADPYQYTGDQIHLDDLIKNNRTIVFEELPWEYSYFPGIMTTERGPVILQHQASIHGRKEFKNCPHCQKGPYGSVTI